MLKTVIVSGLTLLAVAGCVPAGETTMSSSNARPPMGWDARPEAPEWTQRTLAAVARQDHRLTDVVPEDIGVWCPGYEQASEQERRAFWAGLMSAVARYESSWNPKAAGGGGRYIGVMQISPRSAANHGCTADTTAELKDGAANLECAAQMIAASVVSDKMVAGNGRKGAGREWMPFRDAKKRAAMSAWTSAQPYCAI
jgi:hypothetical protein